MMENSVNNYFLQLKESLLILKLKPSLNVIIIIIIIIIIYYYRFI